MSDTRRVCQGEQVRIQEFWRLMSDEFGEARGRSLAADQVLSALGGRNANDALKAGIAPDRIWTALCDHMDVPTERRWGKDVKPRT